MSETAPKEIRATMISAYQLFITLGIFLASMINFNTHILQNSTSWRLTMGISLIFPTIMALGIQWLDESPRWDYRRGNIAKAGRTIAKTYSVAPDHPHVVQELQEIQTALNEERNAEDVKWFDVFTAPTMLKRIVIGCVLQIMQQMTGANYFFVRTLHSFKLTLPQSKLMLTTQYFGPVLFSAAGVGNGYIFAIVLGAVNFGATFGGIWIAGHLSRRKTLIIGALAIAVCHLVSFHFSFPFFNANEAKKDLCRHGRKLRRPIRLFQLHVQGGCGNDRLLLLRHHRFRHDLGTSSLGNLRGNLPRPLPRCLHGNGHSLQLDFQFLDWILHTVYYREDRV